jgi:hypothetical protein
MEEKYTSCHEKPLNINGKALSFLTSMLTIIALFRACPEKLARVSKKLLRPVLVERFTLLRLTSHLQISTDLLQKWNSYLLYNHKKIKS